MFWIIRYIAACCLATGLLASAAVAKENCTVCHKGIKLEGRHAGLPCLACHLRQSTTVGNPSLVYIRTVERSYARLDSGYREKNCDTCHVRSCLDCHEQDMSSKNRRLQPARGSHKGNFTGRAPRDNPTSFLQEPEGGRIQKSVGLAVTTLSGNIKGQLPMDGARPGDMTEEPV